MKQFLLLIFFFTPLQFMAQLPEKINFCISMQRSKQKRNDASFSHTINLLSNLVDKKTVSIEEASEIFQLLLFLNINDSPYDKSIFIEIDGKKTDLPLSYELLLHLLKPKNEEDPLDLTDKRPAASSSFLPGYSDIE